MKATCKTCGATGPPWSHKPSILDPEGVGDPGHKVNPNTNIDDLMDTFLSEAWNCGANHQPYDATVAKTQLEALINSAVKKAKLDTWEEVRLWIKELTEPLDPLTILQVNLRLAWIDERIKALKEANNEES